MASAHLVEPLHQHEAPLARRAYTRAATQLRSKRRKSQRPLLLILQTIFSACCSATERKLRQLVLRRTRSRSSASSTSATIASRTPNSKSSSWIIPHDRRRSLIPLAVHLHACTAVCPGSPHEGVQVRGVHCQVEFKCVEFKLACLRSAAGDSSASEDPATAGVGRRGPLVLPPESFPTRGAAPTGRRARGCYL